MTALSLQPVAQGPKRRRSFIAGTVNEPAAAPPALVDDVPVLTEVVPADAVQSPVAVVAAPAPPLPPPVDGAALARELEAWIDEELPQHVMRVLDGVTDQLIYRIAAHARADLLPRLREAVGAPPPGDPPAD